MTRLRPFWCQVCSPAIQAALGFWNCFLPARPLSLQVQLYATDGGVKLLKRSNGDLERQYRLNVGKLPVAYRWVPAAETVSASLSRWI